MKSVFVLYHTTSKVERYDTEIGDVYLTFADAKQAAMDELIEPDKWEIDTDDETYWSAEHEEADCRVEVSRADLHEPSTTP